MRLSVECRCIYLCTDDQSTDVYTALSAVEVEVDVKAGHPFLSTSTTLHRLMSQYTRASH